MDIKEDEMAHTGNRQGTEPARMVGQILGMRAFARHQIRNIKLRQPCREAGRVLTVRSKAHGWALLFLVFFLTGFQAPQSAVPVTDEEIAAARGLEALLIDHMIQEMRKTVPENDIVPLTQGEKVYRQLLDSEYSRIISESNTLGISDLVLAEIKRKK